MEFCVVRPDGEEYCSDHDGYDPTTGLKLTAVTRKSAELQYRRERGMYPNRIDQPFENIQFFDSIDSSPLVWIRETSDGCFEAFDNRGIHPSEGVALVPVSREHVINMRVCLERKELLAAQSEAEREAQAKKQEADRRAAEALAQRKAYMTMYALRPPSPVQVGVGISNGSNIDTELSRVVKEQFGGQSSTTFLLDTAIGDGVFHRLFSGDSAEVRKLELNQIANKVLLGLFSIDYSENQSIKGAAHADASLELRAIDSSTGTVLEEAFATTNALGYSRREARQKAIDNLMANIRNQMEQ